MTGRLLLASIVVAMHPMSLSASIGPIFDSHENTWDATHIVVVEGEKIVASWKGDLKPGTTLPSGADRFARIPVPPLGRLLNPPREKAAAAIGKHRVLFLAHMPQQGDETKKPMWMAADSAGHPSNPTSITSVAWIEGERVYYAGQMSNPGELVLCELGSLSELKQRVDLGIALRDLFDLAKRDGDAKRCAVRLGVLAPTLASYSRTGGVRDCASELIRCGESAVSIFTRWIVDPGGKYQFRESGLWGLSQLGDIGIDGMIGVLNEETAYWKTVAAELKGRSVRDVTGKGLFTRVPSHLYHLLAQVRNMKLSEANQERLKSHKALLELDRLLREVPGMKPEKSEMVEVHKILQDILAGKFRKDG